MTQTTDIQEVAAILRAATPANDETLSKPGDIPPGININATGKNIVVAAGGSKIKYARRLPALFYCLAIPLIVGIVIVHLPVSSAMAQNLSASVINVAKCENKHTTTVHSELKNKYNYGKYTNMDRKDYYLAMHELNQRKCN